MYVNLRNADHLVALNLISKDNVDRLGMEAIQKILNADGQLHPDFIESEVGLSDLAQIDSFFTQHVFIFNTHAEAVNAIIPDPDDMDVEMYAYRDEVLSDGRVVALFE